MSPLPMPIPLQPYQNESLLHTTSVFVALQLAIPEEGCIHRREVIDCSSRSDGNLDPS